MQVIFQEVLNLLTEPFEIKGSKRLYHLAIREEKPKPLASYYPAIEDEFMPSKVTQWRKEQKNDPKVLRRKTKKMEKDAIREIKKDNITLQEQRQKEKEWKAKSSRKFKVGSQGIRDEV